ncbi:MAG TPA: serine hydrolase [Streptosporangiaceae bacterium]|nr:serine hydrolase [Streptosporangiaceae bacterium]
MRSLWHQGLAVVATCSAITLMTIPVAGLAVTAEAPRPGVRCVSAKREYKPLAERLASDIAARIAGRESSVGLNLTDSRTGITCWYRSTRHFYAASAIKVTILAALLRKAQEQHRHLTEAELHAAWLMITQSDNDAANQLWFDVGIPFIRHFLKLAKMRQTRLAEHWGLSLLTAHDELRLLSLITGPADVLTQSSRIYARYLMAHVTPSQRWGVPAGAPKSVIVHVKNGWLPYPGSQWIINSIGAFTNAHRAYLIAMLTYGNPSMEYGIETIEGVAEVIHHHLNPGERAAVARSVPGPSWGRPDEIISREGR